MKNKNKNKNLLRLVKIVLAILMVNFFIGIPTWQVQADDTDGLNQQIGQKQQQIEQLQDQIDEYQKSIDYQRKQSLSLSNQVNILSNEISKLEVEIKLKESQVEEVNLEIENTQQKIDTAEQNIAKNKDRLAEFLRQVNKQDQVTSIEMALTLESFSEYYNYLHTLSVLEENTGEVLEEIKQFKSEMEIHVAEQEKRRENLEKLKEELEVKQTAVQSNSYAKQSLLTESRNSEAKFQSLVEQLKSEQSAINADIVALEKQIRAKLGGDAGLKSLSSDGFIWPVPNRGITAYFHDPSYPFRYIFEHPAIDIKSAQGSPIKAAASGYVGKVVLNGTNYGYVMLIHADGFATVYGHISKSFVSEDDYVAQGEVIALSGGMPGTTGSGRLSTGPHLHFEVRKNGIPVNPLNYLP